MMGGRSRRRDATRSLAAELLASYRGLQIRVDAVGCMVGQLLREPSHIPIVQQEHSYHHHNADHHTEDHAPIHQAHADHQVDVQVPMHHEQQIDQKEHFDIGEEEGGEEAYG